MTYNSHNSAPFFALEKPLTTMPSARQMRIANLGGFPRLARQLGASPRALLERHNIDPFEIQAPDHLIDCKSFTGLLEECSATFNDPLLGLKLATLHEPDVYGCVVALCRSAPTIRKAIESFIEYIPVTHSPASAQELLESEHSAELRWYVRTDVGENQQANYHAALLILKLLRQIGGHQFQPTHVHLNVDARHRDIERLEQYFDCRFFGGAAFNAIAFPKQFLDNATPSGSRMLFTLLRSYLEKVKRSSEVTLAQKVTIYIRSALASGDCSIETCANKLGMGVRTLQTRLNESGEEFSQLLKQQRVELARAWLDQKQLSLSDIAARLGYMEQSSFGRAFKCWTGMSPQQYRQLNQLTRD